MRGWLVVAATFVATSTLFGITYSFAIFLDAMSEEFGAGNGATALLFGFTIFFLFMLSLPAGRASDRWGPRPLVLFGALVVTVSLLATSVVGNLTLAYVTYGVGLGVGTACGYVPLVSQVSGWFERRRTAALGIAVSGIGVGTLIGPPLVEQLVDERGWRPAFRVLAVVAAIGLTVAALLAARAPSTGDQEPVDLRAVVRDPLFRALYVTGFLMAIALFVPFVFLKPYAESKGISSATAATLVSFLGLGSLAGRLALGAIAGRLGVLRVYQLCFVVQAGSFLLWLVAGGSYALLAAFAVVLGTSYGGYVALSPAAAAELFGVVGLGTILGAMYTAGGIGGLIGPPSAGWLIDATGGYEAAIIIAMALGVVATVLLQRALAKA
ncbi:MAG: MFS family permease [Acidimicrobiales bacterium]|jgi:MFS family permease